MRLSFYNKLINSLEKVEAVTLEEKNDKAAALVAICGIIRKRDPENQISVTWNKTKWKVAEYLPDKQ
jgi:hypothetical protein